MSTQVDGGLQALSDSLAGAVESVGRSVVAVYARRQPSSGVQWRSGVVVTADHTIDREDGITVGLPDGRNVPATVAGRDSGTDIAVLRIGEENLPPVSTVGLDALKVGGLALAVARPGEGGLSASLGVLSVVGGESWRTWSGGQIDALIRPDLTLYPGFSGGPLVTAGGQVAGINTSGLSRAMGLTIPATTVDRVVDALLSRGKVARGYLGLGMQPVRLPESLQGAAGNGQSTGLLVISVENSGPAERAGFLLGDILVSLAGKPVTDTHDVQGALGSESVGQGITAKVLRGGQPVDLTATVGERPGRGD